jgi:opacity protein-like surface antigen
MKKSILAIAALLVFSFTSFAQMTITPYVQGDFSYAIPFKEKQAYKDNLSPQLGYTFGINIDYAFNEKWSLKTGLMFQNMGDKYPYQSVSPLIGIWFDAYELKQNYQFINIPIQAQYNFNTESKFSPYVALGAAVNWNMNSYYISKKYANDERIDRTKGQFDDNYKQTINFSAKTDIGFRYQFNEKLALNTFLSGNMLLLPTSKNDYYKLHHYNIGLGVGLSFKV